MASDLAILGISIGAGLAILGGAIGTGIAEKSIGSAAVAAIAENEKFFGKGLLFTVIPETILIFALVVAFMIMGLAGGA